MLRLAIIALFLATGPALAHHPLAGQPMETFGHGLLSGIGHPVLGFDHLYFVLAAGLAAQVAGIPLRGPAAYVTAMLAGCAALYAGLDIPLREPVIALSLVIVGGVLALGRATSPAALTTLFAGFGLFHGAAFAGALTAQEGGVSGSVLAGYLIGLGVLQFAVATGAGWFGARVLQARDEAALPARLAGAAVAGAGLFLCLELVEAPLVSLLAG